MKYRQRTFYTEEQKAIMWDRWQQGETLGSIARLFNRYHSSIERILAETGGIRPAQRRRIQCIHSHTPLCYLRYKGHACLRSAKAI